MYRLIYVSSACQPLTADEISELLDVSITNNALRNITGFLIYAEGEFIQILEGKKLDVEFIFDKISNDKRHHGIKVLVRENIKRRSFETWSMGFKALQQHELKPIDHSSPTTNVKTLAKYKIALKLYQSALKTLVLE
jgi:Sensors of blue-light using FAD